MRVKAVALGVAVAVVAALLATQVVGGGRGEDASDDAAPISALPSPTAAPVQAAPGGGDVSEVVEPSTAGPTVEAGWRQQVRLDDGVRVAVLGARAARAPSGGPGEAGGPVVVGRFEIENGSDDVIDVDGAMVTLLYGDDQVAQPSTADPFSPFQGSVPPGESTTGTYVFSVPGGTDASLSAVVQYGAGTGVASFVQ